MTRVQVWFFATTQYGDRVWATKVVTDDYGSGEELLPHGMGTREACRTL